MSSHATDLAVYAKSSSSSSVGQLRSHRLVHTGGTLRCTWRGCDFRATRAQSLKYHLLTHTQEKAHQCEVCGQSFSLAKNLKRHMLSHVNSAAKHKSALHLVSFASLRGCQQGSKKTRVLKNPTQWVFGGFYWFFWASRKKWVK